MTLGAISSTLTFAKTSGTQTITSAGKTIDAPVAIDGVGGTVSLQDALSVTGTLTLTSGTLDLAGYTATTSIFSSSNSNTRVLAFGTGKIVLTGNAATIFTTLTSTNLTVTGTNPLIQATYSGSTGSRILQIGASGESNAISLDVTAGSDSIGLGTTSGAYKNVDFTGFTGTFQAGSSIICYGNWNWGGVTSVTSTSNTTFSATSGTKTITSNGVTFPANVTFDGVGGIWSMQDALTLGSTRALTLTNGTLQLKAGTTSTVGSFATTGTTMKYLQSSTAGTQATISDASGTNTVSYLTIQDSNATGGSSWLAPFASNNVYGGNNTGWLFGTQYSSTLAESAKVTDVVNTSNQMSVGVVESASISDSSNSAFLWNTIDNAQSAGWGVISNTQSAGWQNIDTL
jgi:hypothetical protein